MEVEDVRSTDTMVGAEGTDVCDDIGKYMTGNKQNLMSNIVGKMFS